MALLAVPCPSRAAQPTQLSKPAASATSLFDGKTLRGWMVVDEFDFKEHGRAYVKDGRLVLEKGKPFTGVKWTGKFPTVDYEVSLDAMRIDGDDFFCSMVFPIGKQQCSVTFGGWGGSTVGLTNIDGEPAVENETATIRDFKNNQWYHLRFRVTRARIEVWIDKDKVVDFPYQDRKLTIRWEQESILPFGISSYRTTAAMKNVTVRPVRKEARKPDEKPQATDSRAGGKALRVVVPVTGAVLLDGKPVVGAAVILMPRHGRPALGTTDAQGKFTLSTYTQGGGALPGVYGVTIVPREVRGATTEQDGRAGGNPPGSIPQQPIVPKKYSDPRTSPLTAKVKGPVEKTVINLSSE